MQGVKHVRIAVAAPGVATVIAVRTPGQDRDQALFDRLAVTGIGPLVAEVHLAVAVRRRVFHTWLPTGARSAHVRGVVVSLDDRVPASTAKRYPLFIVPRAIRVVGVGPFK